MSLGFHESCHRADFRAWITAHPLPSWIKLNGTSITDGLRKGTFPKLAQVTPATLERLANSIKPQIEAWVKQADDDSYRRNEVGYRKSTFHKSGPRKR